MSAIDRDIVIKKYINPDIEKFHNSDVKIVLENLKQNILKMPPVKRPQGEWICKGDWAECSLCGADSGTIMDGLERVPRYTRFCPECGAKMKGE